MYSKLNCTTAILGKSKPKKIEIEVLGVVPPYTCNFML